MLWDHNGALGEVHTEAHVAWATCEKELDADWEQQEKSSK
jgi:hypothetical protein